MEGVHRNFFVHYGNICGSVDEDCEDINCAQSVHTQVKLYLK